MVIGAILAGGVGNRAGGEVPKQFLDMCGRTLIERTVDAFEQHPRVDEVLVVCHPEHIARMEAIRQRSGSRKWQRVIEGGSERYLSSYAAVRACQNDDDTILIHDAARPFVSQTLISQLIDAVEQYGAAVPVIPLSDTLLSVDENFVKCAEKRQNFRLAQTPQAFLVSRIRSAFEMVIDSVNTCVTDDCSILLQAFPQEKIKMVDGELSNLKLTYHADIEKFNKIFAEKS